MLTTPSRGLLAAALTIALAAVLAPAAAAQTLDSPWTGSGSPTVSVVSDGASAPAELTYARTASSGNWEFSTTAGSARTVELDWTYDGFHSWAGVTVGLDAFVTRGGDTTTTPLVNAGPTWCCAGEPSGGFDYDGTVTLSVQPGDTYGFKLRGSHGDVAMTLNGTLTVDEPEGVEAVSCDLGVDSTGSSTPGAAAGFRLVNASDAGTGIASLVITDGVFTSGELTPGSSVQLEVVPGDPGSDTRPGPGVLAAVIRTSGQPSLVAKDGAGHVTTVACGPVDPLPPPPPPADSDGDGVPDAGDNCPAVSNADQRSIDGDAEGDACDADDDNDRVSDAAETRLGTSSTDLDSDDDGLRDGQEDRNGDGRKGKRETHPARFDTDRDGLGDGLERGVGRGVADPPGPIAGTGKRFRPDRHPRSKTSALRADTDRGSVPDGREDKNRNGRVDKGETDPRKPGDRPRRRRG